MTNPLWYPTKKISHNSIEKNKNISWIIKYDLIKSDTIYKLILPEDIEFTQYSEEIIYIRKFNKENYPYKYYIFNLYTNNIFLIINNQKNTNCDTIDEQTYNDDNLEYNYGRREESKIE